MPSLVRRIGMPCLTLHLPNGTVTIHSSRRARFERARRVIVVAIFKSVLPHPVITHPTPSTCARRNTRPPWQLRRNLFGRQSYTPLSSTMSVSRSTRPWHAYSASPERQYMAPPRVSLHACHTAPHRRRDTWLRRLTTEIRHRILPCKWVAAQSLRLSYTPLSAAMSLSCSTRGRGTRIARHIADTWLSSCSPSSAKSTPLPRSDLPLA